MLYAAAAFVALGFGYWTHSKGNLAACVFQNGECSTAVATWLLVAITSCAFLAASYAAIKAADTYVLETEPLLGQSICRDPKIPPLVKLYVDSQLSAIAYLANGRNDNDFYPMDFEFENLGRSALAQIRVKIKISTPASDPNPKETTEEIRVGNIGVNKAVIVRVHMPKTFATFPVVTWYDATMLGESIDFHRFRESVAIELQTSRNKPEPDVEFYFP